jgi:hypothetical protein
MWLARELRGFVFFANLRRKKPFKRNVILVSRLAQSCAAQVAKIGLWSLHKRG